MRLRAGIEQHHGGGGQDGGEHEPGHPAAGAEVDHPVRRAQRGGEPLGVGHMTLDRSRPEEAEGGRLPQHVHQWPGNVGRQVGKPGRHGARHGLRQRRWA